MTDWGGLFISRAALAPVGCHLLLEPDASAYRLIGTLFFGTILSIHALSSDLSDSDLTMNNPGEGGLR
jgi:hypothetical protein